VVKCSVEFTLEFMLWFSSMTEGGKNDRYTLYDSVRHHWRACTAVARRGADHPQQQGRYHREADLIQGFSGQPDHCPGRGGRIATQPPQGWDPLLAADPVSGPHLSVGDRSPGPHRLRVRT